MGLQNQEFVMYLSSMKVGQKARIKQFNPGDRSYRLQLLAMGLTPGTEFELIHVAPLGDPIEISVRGFALCLRKEEAQILQLEGVQP